MVDTGRRRTVWDVALKKDVEVLPIDAMEGLRSGAFLDSNPSTESIEAADTESIEAADTESIEAAETTSLEDEDVA